MTELITPLPDLVVVLQYPVHGALRAQRPVLIEKRGVYLCRRLVTKPLTINHTHGRKLRSITTDLGAASIELPRARQIKGGQEREWQSRLIDPALRAASPVGGLVLLETYLAGANGHRIRGALSAPNTGKTGHGIRSALC